MIDHIAINHNHYFALNRSISDIDNCMPR